MKGSILIDVYVVTGSHPSQLQEANLTFLTVCILLIFDTILYMTLTWYIEAVFPGKYGVAKPFYFPFQPSYWLGQKGRGSGLLGKHWSSLRSGSTHHVTLEEEEMEMTCKNCSKRFHF